MLGVTFFGLFLTPVFYVALRKLTGNRPLKLHGEVPHLADDDSFVSAEHPAAPHHDAGGSSGGGAGLRPQPAAPLKAHD
jgi:multidrug efflux pump